MRGSIGILCLLGSAQIQARETPNRQAGHPFCYRRLERFTAPFAVVGPAHFRDLSCLSASRAVAPRAQIVRRAPGSAEGRHGLLLGAVGCGHRARGGVSCPADQLFNDAIGREGTRRKNMCERRVRARLLDHELGAAPIEDDRDPPTFCVMQHTQRLRKLRASGVLVASSQGLQVRPCVEDIRAIDEEVFFKSHSGRMEWFPKLAINWQWPQRLCVWVIFPNVLPLLKPLLRSVEVGKDRIFNGHPRGYCLIEIFGHHQVTRTIRNRKSRLSRLARRKGFPDN